MPEESVEEDSIWQHEMMGVRWDHLRLSFVFVNLHTIPDEFMVESLILLACV